MIEIVVGSAAGSSGILSDFGDDQLSGGAKDESPHVRAGATSWDAGELRVSTSVQANQLLQNRGLLAHDGAALGLQMAR